jgi:MFS family permease
MKENNRLEKVDGKRWIYVVFSIILMMCLGTVYSWSIFRGAVEELYGVHTTQSGLPYMVSLASYAVSMLLAGRHLGKWSPRKSIFIGGILVALGWFLSGYATNIYMLTLTYGVLIGAGVGIAYGPPIQLMNRWFPKTKGLMVGLTLGGFGLSPFITAPIASYLVDHYGLLASFKFLAIGFFILMPIIAFPMAYPKETLKEAENQEQNTAKEEGEIPTNQMVRSKSFKVLYCTFFIGTMIGLMIVGMTTGVGMEYMGLSHSSVTLWMSVFAVFNGIGRPIFGTLADKLPIKNVMLLSYLLIAAAALMMITGIPLFYGIAFSIFWLNLGGWLAIAPTLTGRLYGQKHYMQNYGVVFTAYGLGAVLGVLLSGALKDFFQSYVVVFYFVLILCAIGIFISRRVSEKA